MPSSCSQKVDTTGNFPYLGRCLSRTVPMVGSPRVNSVPSNCIEQTVCGSDFISASHQVSRCGGSSSVGPQTSTPRSQCVTGEESNLEVSKLDVTTAFNQILQIHPIPPICKIMNEENQVGFCSNGIKQTTFRLSDECFTQQSFTILGCPVHITQAVIQSCTFTRQLKFSTDLKICWSELRFLVFMRTP